MNQNIGRHGSSYQQVDTRSVTVYTPLSGGLGWSVSRRKLLTTDRPSPLALTGVLFFVCCPADCMPQQQGCKQELGEPKFFRTRFAYFALKIFVSPALKGCTPCCLGQLVALRQQPKNKARGIGQIHRFYPLNVADDYLRSWIVSESIYCAKHCSPVQVVDDKPGYYGRCGQCKEPLFKFQTVRADEIQLARLQDHRDAPCELHEAGGCGEADDCRIDSVTGKCIHTGWHLEVGLQTLYINDEEIAEQATKELWNQTISKAFDEDDESCFYTEWY